MPWLKTDPLIFLAAGGFILVFVAGTIAFSEGARQLYGNVSGALMENFGWLYIGGVSLIFIFLIVLFVSPYGNLKLGDDGDEPEYSTPVWFGMLFAAGLGATLMFWGAAEPLHHAYNPPRGDMEPMSQGGHHSGLRVHVLSLRGAHVGGLHPARPGARLLHLQEENAGADVFRVRSAP